MDIDDIDVEYCTADEVVRRRATSSVAWLPHDDRRATWKVKAKGKARQTKTIRCLRPAQFEKRCLLFQLMKMVPLDGKYSILD